MKLTNLIRLRIYLSNKVFRMYWPGPKYGYTVFWEINRCSYHVLSDVISVMSSWVMIQPMNTRPTCMTILGIKTSTARDHFVLYSTFIPPSVINTEFQPPSYLGEIVKSVNWNSFRWKPIFTCFISFDQSQRLKILSNTIQQFISIVSVMMLIVLFTFLYLSLW